MKVFACFLRVLTSTVLVATALACFFYGRQLKSREMIRVMETALETPGLHMELSGEWFIGIMLFLLVIPGCLIALAIHNLIPPQPRIIRSEIRRRSRQD